MDADDYTPGILHLRAAGGTQRAAACRQADLEGDHDDDQDDFGRLQRCYIGANVLAHAYCAG